MKIKENTLLCYSIFLFLIMNFPFEFKSFQIEKKLIELEDKNNARNLQTNSNEYSNEILLKFKCTTDEVSKKSEKLIINPLFFDESSTNANLDEATIEYTNGTIQNLVETGKVTFKEQTSGLKLKCDSEENKVILKFKNSLSSMNSMFLNSQIYYINIIKFDSSTLNNLNAAFKKSSLEYAFLSKIEASNIDAKNAFDSCSNLKILDIKNINYASSGNKISDLIGSMLLGCTSLKILDMSSIDMKEIKDNGVIIKDSPFGLSSQNQFVIKSKNYNADSNNNGAIYDYYDGATYCDNLFLENGKCSEDKDYCPIEYPYKYDNRFCFQPILENIKNDLTPCLIGANKEGDSEKVCYPIESTLSGFYYDFSNEKFQKCGSGCSNSDNVPNVDDCLICKTCDTTKGYYSKPEEIITLKNGITGKNCYKKENPPERFYFDKKENALNYCAKGCLTCDMSEDEKNLNCLTCDSDYSLFSKEIDKNSVNKICYNLSEIETNNYLDPKDKIIKKCEEGCLKCTKKINDNEPTCSKCDIDKDYFPAENDNGCFKEKEGYSLDKIDENNKTTWIWYLNKCDVKNCKKCEERNEKKCSICSNGFYLENNSCNNCSKAISNCLECSDSETCDLCDDDFSKTEDNKCKNSCGINDCNICSSKYVECTMCKDGLIIIGDICSEFSEVPKNNKINFKFKASYLVQKDEQTLKLLSDEFYNKLSNDQLITIKIYFADDDYSLIKTIYKIRKNSNFQSEGIVVPIKTISNFYKIYTSIEISGDVKTLEGAFANCHNLVSYTAINNPMNINSLKGMFKGCSSLEEVDLERFKNDGITDISYMFENCSNLIRADFSSFNFSKLKNMEYIFSGCSKIESINLKGIIPANFTDNEVEKYEGAFAGCYNLTNLDISGIVIDSKIFNLTEMIEDSKKLKEVYISSQSIDNNFNESISLKYNLETLELTPNGCLSGYYLTDNYCLKCEINNCLECSSLNICTKASGDNYYLNDKGNPKTIENLLEGFSMELQYITSEIVSTRDLISTIHQVQKGFIYANGKQFTLDSLFSNPTRILSEIKRQLETLNSSKVYMDIKDDYPDLSYLFKGVEKLRTVKFKKLKSNSNINSIKLTEIFSGCKSLEEVDTSNLDNITIDGNIEGMFYNCPNIKKIDFRGLDMCSQDTKEIMQIFGENEESFANTVKIILSSDCMTYNNTPIESNHTVVIQENGTIDIIENEKEKVYLEEKVVKDNGYKSVFIIFIFLFITVFLLDIMTVCCLIKTNKAGEGYWVARTSSEGGQNAKV